MRWLAVWIVLTGVFFAGQLVAPLFSGAISSMGATGVGHWEYTREDLAHLATIPLVQLAAIWIVVLVRRHSWSQHFPGPTPPPPAPETPASRPDEEP
jgi:hypothetical protein